MGLTRWGVTRVNYYRVTYRERVSRAHGKKNCATINGTPNKQMENFMTFFTHEVINSSSTFRETDIIIIRKIFILRPFRINVDYTINLLEWTFIRSYTSNIHKIMIKSITILFKIEINMTICPTNKLCAKYIRFIHFKIWNVLFIIIVFFDILMSNTLKHH